MTKNQIDYFAAKEQEKHNRAVEQETVRSNLAKEANTREQIAQESAHYARQDLINQEHYRRMDAETQRHQIATEGISRMSNAITQAHYERSDANAAYANSINLSNLEETKRHQRAMEGLTERLNESQIALNNSSAALNSAKEYESYNQGFKYARDAELTRQQTLTEVMKTELTKQQALTSQSQRELNVANMAAVPWNSAANVLGGIGRLIGGFKGISLGTGVGSGYPSSTTYNSVTGLYE